MKYTEMFHQMVKSIGKGEHGDYFGRITPRVSIHTWDQLNPKNQPPKTIDSNTARRYSRKTYKYLDKQNLQVSKQKEIYLLAQSNFKKVDTSRDFKDLSQPRKGSNSRQNNHIDQNSFQGQYYSRPKSVYKKYQPLNDSVNHDLLRNLDIVQTKIRSILKRSN